MSRPITRRRFLTGTAGIGATAALAPALLSACGGGGQQQTTKSGLEEYKSASIDWKQASGQKVNVAIISASYFEDLKKLLPQFEELTGIKVTTEEIPPPEIRHKVILDYSSHGRQYHTSATDPDYYPLFVKNKWVAPLAEFMQDPKLTDAKWFDAGDILPAWRKSVQVDGKWYGIPYDGEVTVQVYRTDLFDKAGLKPAQTLPQFTANAQKLNDPGKRIWGAALRGVPGAGQNMYIWPSIFRELGGQWFDKSGSPTVNSDAGVKALEWYVNLAKYEPKAATNWNWPDIADAFAQGTVASYIDADFTVSVLRDPTKSVVVDKIGFARWPAGPTGTRVSSIWNWSFSINADFPREQQIATWLFIQWATCKETQIRTSYAFSGNDARTGVNRVSIRNAKQYHDKFAKLGRGYLETVNTAYADDEDPGWRPRVPEWPAIGDRMATAIQAALTGQSTPKAALDQVNTQIAQLMK